MRGGTVLNVSSAQGLVSWPMMPTYTAAKTGIIAYTRSAGHELEFRSHGVRIMSLCPHATVTPMRDFEKYVGMSKTGQSVMDSLDLETDQLSAKDTGEAAVTVMEKGKSASVWFVYKSGVEPYEVPDQNTWENLMSYRPKKNRAVKLH